MATAVGFEGANTVYRAPRGMSQAECYDLQSFADGEQIISCWRLTRAEIAEIARTGVVWLSVMGQALPPVLVSGTALVLIDGAPSRPEPALPIAPRTGG